MEHEIRRRNVLSGIGVAVTAGALAGCSTETQDGGDGGDGDTGTEGGDGGDGGTGTEGGDGGGGSNEVPSEVSEYLSDTPNFEGSVEDMTGEDEVTVTVGGGGDLLFKPAAIRVDAGTNVVWEWAGGTHNVVHEEGNFESELYSDEGETFEHTFEDSGNFRYYCQPHEQQGMKGAVVVE